MTKEHSNLVVHQHGDESWYFWAEGTTNEYGPFPTKEAALDGLQEYCLFIAGE